MTLPAATVQDLRKILDQAPFWCGRCGRRIPPGHPGRTTHRFRLCGITSEDVERFKKERHDGQNQ